MLECRMYSAQEIWKYLGVRNNSDAKKKLNRYNIVYFLNEDKKKIGKNANFNILEIREPFKVYSVFDMGFDPHSDFGKLRNFLFFLLGDDEYCWLPDEPLETYLRSKGHTISRATIAKYRERLTILEYYCNSGDFIYYRVYKDYNGTDHHQQVEADEYNKAWHLYWDKRNEEQWNSEQAFGYMYAAFGGVPRKQAVQYKNLFHEKELNYLMDLVSNSILEEVSYQRKR